MSTPHRGRNLAVAVFCAAVVGAVLVVPAAVGAPADTNAATNAAAAAAAANTVADTAPRTELATEPVTAADEPALDVPPGVVDEAVSFTVVNRNTSALACPSDGETYTISGHLTGPATMLGGGRAVTVYEHGIASGEWYWRVPVEGYHHSYEMAERGHVSLTIDRLGYDASDRPDGRHMCIGSQADMLHQIVQALRSGEYEWAGDTPAPSFTEVTTLGHSNGGQVVQLEAISYGDVDGMVVSGWADGGLTDEATARFQAALGSCMSGGTPSEEPDDPSGYALYDLGRREFVEGNFADTEPEVIEYSAGKQNKHPCGDMVSQLAGVMVDAERLREIDVPVLFLYGELDARVQLGGVHKTLLAGAPSTTLVEVPSAGHYFDLARQHEVALDGLTSWLDGEGF